jgi:8-oxo-dGTP pyrophosphatase MutT (NUDIX family)
MRVETSRRLAWPTPPALAGAGQANRSGKCRKAVSTRANYPWKPYCARCARRPVSATAVLDRWLSFDLPDHLLGIALKGRYRGQRQLWFALRFNGSDGEFGLRRRVAHRPEFEGWTWAPPCDAISRAVPWKKTMYATVLRAFVGLIKAV